MTYPSKTKEARRQSIKDWRDKQKELLRQVNERLSPMGINHSELLRLIVDGKVEIKIKEGNHLALLVSKIACLCTIPCNRLADLLHYESIRLGLPGQIGTGVPDAPGLIRLARRHPLWQEAQ